MRRCPSWKTEPAPSLADGRLETRSLRAAPHRYRSPLGHPLSVHFQTPVRRIEPPVLPLVRRWATVRRRTAHSLQPPNAKEFLPPDTAVQHSPQPAGRIPLPDPAEARENIPTPLPPRSWMGSRHPP